MNKKVEIWKRKLRKNERKVKQACWDRLKYVHKDKLAKTQFISYYKFATSLSDYKIDNLADTLAKQIRNEIDADILNKLTKNVDT